MNRVLIVVAVVMAAVAVGVIFLLRGGPPAPGAAHATATATASATVSASSSPVSSSPQPADARGDARAFLASYLPYLYGRTSLTTVVHVDASIRPLLPAARQQISAQEEAKPFAVTDLQVTDSSGVATVTAQVSEGDPAVGLATYPVTFAMRQRPDGWDVVTVPI
ncbi:MAG: hypothetical protein DLM54_04600, partial [Acidimicrobiales bacterium]